MTAKRTAKPYPAELRERAVRLVREQESEHLSLAAAIRSVAAKIGCSAETLRLWVRQAERDGGRRAGANADEGEWLKALERGFASSGRRMRSCARRARISPRRSSTAAPSHDRVHRRSPRRLRARADLQGAADRPSTYHGHGARRADPAKAPPRAQRDAELGQHICGVFKENFGVDGMRKVWRQLGREGIEVARCTVARLMRATGLAGIVRGRAKRTTVSDQAAPCPLDRVNRDFKAERPNALWVADLTYVATWAGFVHVAFIIEAFARRIVGWRVARSAQTGFVLDPLEQALHDRRPIAGGDLVHHSDRGVQYVSITYTERLAAAGIEPSVGSVCDSYANALAETVIRLFKTEVIRRLGPWRSLEAVESATLAWVDWFNHRRLLEPIGNMPPAEAEERCYATWKTAVAA